MEAFGGGLSGAMLKSHSGLGRLGEIWLCARSLKCGGLVAGLAIGTPDKVRAACEGPQISTVIVGCVGWEATTIPELTGMLPSKTQNDRTALRMGSSHLQSRFTGIFEG